MANLGTALSVAQTLFAALECSLLKEAYAVSKYESDLEGLKSTVTTIKSVLVDAGNKVKLSETDLNYIQKLKDAVYDADDLFDRFITIAARKHNDDLSDKSVMGMADWQGNDLYLQANSNIEDLSYIFEETTPIKTYADLDYQFDDCEILSKTPQVDKENSPPSKRRRVLDFNSDSEEISYSVLQSKKGIDAYDVDLPELDAFLQDDFFPPAVNFVQNEAWITECLNDTDLNISSEDGNASATSSVHIGVKEGSSLSYDSASSNIQRPVRSSRNIIFKGRKSYMRTPSKVPSAIAYPFDFIKPSSVQGHVTLKDINEHILTPKSKFKKVEEETVFPTSAFSGKPVVGKTKIPTRGQGSITIMRTKG